VSIWDHSVIPGNACVGLIEQVLHKVESTACRPDHSLFYWEMELDLCFSKEVVGSMQASFTVFDRSSISADFMQSNGDHLNSLISRLE
jgi:hypothetical protein